MSKDDYKKDLPAPASDSEEDDAPVPAANQDDYYDSIVPCSNQDTVEQDYPEPVAMPLDNSKSAASPQPEEDDSSVPVAVQIKEVSQTPAQVKEIKDPQVQPA